MVRSDHNDRIYGDSQENHLYGGEGDDLIEGGAGNDLLFGGAGVDEIDGGNGDDVIRDGAGHHGLVTGGGADTFVFSTSDAYALPRYSAGNPEALGFIKDFSQAEGDQIWIVGSTEMTFIADDAFSGAAGELRLRPTRHKTR